MDNIEIINLALSHIGAQNIDSLSEGTNESKAANLYYNPVRRMVLQKYPWNFATKTSRLALVDSQPVNFTYAYALPTDCVKVINITPNTEAYFADGNKNPFLIQGNNLLCDLDEVYLTYIYDVVDTNLFDDSFVDAFSHLLASRMAMRITGDRDLQVTELSIYDGLVSEAGSLNVNESKETKEINPYVDARN